MTWIVYKLTDPEGRAYIGISGRTLAVRFKQHCKEAWAGSNLAIHCGIRKYGSDGFKTEILTECVNQIEAKVCERALISAHGTYIRSGRGYNLTIGGDGAEGWRPSDETRAIWRAQRAGRTLSPEWRAALSESRKGRKLRVPRSEEWRAKQSAGKKGRMMSAEWRAKIGAAGLGRKQTKETIEKRMATRLKNKMLKAQATENGHGA